MHAFTTTKYPTPSNLCKITKNCITVLFYKICVKILCTSQLQNFIQVRSGLPPSKNKFGEAYALEEAFVKLYHELPPRKRARLEARAQRQRTEYMHGRWEGQGQGAPATAQIQTAQGVETVEVEPPLTRTRTAATWTSSVRFTDQAGGCKHSHRVGRAIRIQDSAHRRVMLVEQAQGAYEL